MKLADDATTELIQRFDQTDALDVTALENLLAAKAPKKDVFAAMKTVSAAIVRIATEVLAGKEMIGPDDRDGIREVVSIALLRGRPGLDRLLDEFFARPEVKADVEELQFDETSDVFSVGNFLICSSDPDINPSVEEQAEQVRIPFTEPRER